MAGNKEVASLFVELRGTFAKFNSDMASVSKTMSGVGRNISRAFGKLNTVLGAAIGVGAVFSLNKFSDAVVDLANKGDELDDVTESFERLGGSTSSLKAAQDAVLGTVSAVDLMKMANEGLLKQLPGFDENFGKIADLGGRVAQALGVDAKQGIQQVIDALSSAKTKQLEAIGITVNTEKAYADYAKAMGVTANQLNDLQKKEAVRLAAMQQIEPALGRLSAMQMSAAEAQKAYAVALEDAMAQMGSAINANEDLTQAYLTLASAIERIDWKTVGANIAQVAAVMTDVLGFAIEEATKTLDAFVRTWKILGIMASSGAPLKMAQGIQAQKEALEALDGAAKTAQKSVNAIGQIAMMKDAEGNFVRTAEGLNKMKAAAQELNAAIKQGGFADPSYIKAQSMANDAIRLYKEQIKETTPLAKQAGVVSEKALDDAAKAAKKATDEVDRLKNSWTESVNEFNQKSIQDGIKKQLEDAIGNLDAGAFNNLKKQLSDAVEEGFVDEWKEAIEKGAVSEGDVRAQATRVAEIQTGEWSESFESKSKEAYENSIETWRGLFENAITGETFNLEKALNQVAVGFAAQLAQSIFGSIGGLNISSPGDLGAGIFNSLFGGGGGGGGGFLQGLGIGGAGGSGLLSGIGSLFGFGGGEGAIMGGMGPLSEGASLLASLGIGAETASSIAGVTSALGPYAIAATAAFTAFEKFGGMEKLGKVFGFGGPTNKETLARREFIGKLEEMLQGKNVSFFNKEGAMEKFNGNLVLGSSDRFNDGSWADKFNATDSARTFDAIGIGLNKLLGITEDVGSQIGFILSENLNGNIDNARILMKSLGVTQDQMIDQFVALGEEGTMSWHAVEVALQGVGAAFGEGLVKQGAFAEGFQQIIDSGGDGMDAIVGIQNAAIEATEANITSFEQWKAQLIAAGKDPAYVDALFAGLQQRGLKTFEDIKNATTRVLGGVIADMESFSPQLAGIWHKAQEEAQKYVEEINKIPDDATKNVTFNVSANVSDDARATVNALNSGGAVGEVPALASGGIVRKPTLGLIGEAGPEAVLPLSKLDGMMKGAGLASSRGAVQITINAPNAQAGVESEIRRAIHEMEGRIVDTAMAMTMDSVRRGGAYSSAFGR